MRMSCNGCRVLRKGCSDKCSIKSCLQWIKSPESQANATVFLAKFYGRAGLLNLLNAGPSHLRPGIFRSLLYEACGRIVNPIYGATGLLMAGNWQLCQAAVDAVLSGSPIKQESVDSADSTVCPPLKACDIRHVSKINKESGESGGPVKGGAGGGGGVRKRMRGGGKVEKAVVVRAESPDVDDAARVMWSWCRKEEEVDGSTSRDSGLSQQHGGGNMEQQSGHAGGGGGGNGGGGDDESGASEGSVQAAVGKEVEGRGDDGELELELTLGFEPVLKRRKVQLVDDAMCTRPVM